MTDSRSPDDHLASFITKHRLRVTRDSYNRRICQGRNQSLIADHGSGRLTVLLMGKSARWWNTRRNACLAVGCRLEQNGDTEGSLSFDPNNQAQALTAIKTAGVKRRRVASAAQLQNLAHGDRTRFQPRKPTIAGSAGVFPQLGGGTPTWTSTDGG